MSEIYAVKLGMSRQNDYKARRHRQRREADRGLIEQVGSMVKKVGMSKSSRHMGFL